MFALFFISVCPQVDVRVMLPVLPAKQLQLTKIQTIPSHPPPRTSRPVKMQPKTAFNLVFPLRYPGL